MAAATQFFQYWALAFATLCVALVLLNLFYRLIDFDLDLHSFRKETVIAAFVSAVQGAGFWFAASLFPGQPFRRLVIPGMIVAIIYWVSHLEDWNGYEIGGLAYFQAALISTGLLLVTRQFELAVMISGAFLLGLVIIALIAKSL